jgi:hypothetical protein
MATNDRFASRREMAEKVVSRILDEVVCPTEDFSN